MKKLKLILFSLVILISSCQSSDNDIEDNLLKNNDYLIFGHFYGECIGDSCVENFKLTTNKLYRDSNHSYGSSTFNFDELLSNNLFNNVTNLEDFFPNELLNNNDQTFGCPDCYDQGGLYIILNKDNVITEWYMDNTQNDIPVYLHEFSTITHQKINLILN